MSSLASLLTLAGAAILFLALGQIGKLIAALPDPSSQEATGRHHHLRRRWQLLAGLVVLFIPGYLGLAASWWSRQAAWIDLVEPGILFLGAIFVRIVTGLSLRTTTDLQRLAEAEIKALNAERERDRAKAANLAKSSFLATMSHEIRTPMNGVIGMTGLLLDTPLTEEQADYARTIRNSGEALLGIINEILDFSKFEAGKVELERIAFDVRAVIEDVLELVAFKAQEKGLELGLLMKPDVPARALGDPGRIRQILLNLLSNAIKFTTQGEIVVEVQMEGSLIRFDVSDTGPGMAPEVLDRLFQPFSQADASTTRRFGGTGLGLAICKQLVGAMDGRIWVSSEEGKGSTFSFTLRLEWAGDAPPMPTSDIVGLRVLIVDDSQLNCKVFAEQLRSWGCEALIERDPCQVVDSLRRQVQQGMQVDVGLIDFQMPGLDGGQLARLIKADPAIAKISLVLVTSLPHRDDARELGDVFSGYLTKPVRCSTLRDTLATVAGLRQSPSKEIKATLVTAHALAEQRLRSKFRILVAEDNVVNQRVVTRILEKAGYTCDVVANGEEAVEAVQRISYDAVLMDCQMPVMDGYEATRRIRALPGERSTVPILAATAGVTVEERQSCLEAGMTTFVAKPIQSQQLLKLLEETLKTADDNVWPRNVADAERLNLRRLDQATAGDAAFRDELLESFCLELDTCLKSLGREPSDGDRPRLRRLGHGLKSWSYYVGAMKLSRMAECIEKEAAVCRLDTLRQQLISLHEEADLVLQDISGQMAQAVLP